MGNSILGDVSSLDGWAIVIAGGRQLLGKLSNDNASPGAHVTLSPVYMYLTQLHQQAGAGFAIQRFALPYDGFASVARVDVIADSIVRLGELSEQDSNVVRALISQAEAAGGSARPGNARITLATSLPNGKPRP